jgi:hypothetical protein
MPSGFAAHVALSLHAQQVVAPLQVVRRTKILHRMHYMCLHLHAKLPGLVRGLSVLLGFAAGALLWSELCS